MSFLINVIFAINYHQYSKYLDQYPILFDQFLIPNQEDQYSNQEDQFPIRFHLSFSISYSY